MMNYLLVAAGLFIVELLYFRIADHFNIIDKPNHRSAHSEITLRGGGVVFPVAFVMFFVVQCWQNYSFPLQHYLWFGGGLLMICGISFVDDIMDLSRKIRILFHFLAATLLLVFVNAFQLLPFWSIPLLYIFIIGIFNAFNFMDGINGMSGLYSLVTLLSLLYVNENRLHFADTEFIVYPIVACLVFLFFNFRTKAKCFMGDVGSLGIAFWVLALLGLLILKSGDLKYLFFLTVFGTEVILTIVERLGLKENIFEAHRRHLYQLFANEFHVSHLTVSFFYALLQVFLNVLLILLPIASFYSVLLVLLISGGLYLFIKWSVKRQLKSKISP